MRAARSVIRALRLAASEGKPGTKLCLDCKQALPLDAFYRHPDNRDGRQSRCKPCDNRNRATRALRGGGGPEVVRRPDGSLEVVRMRRRS